MREIIIASRNRGKIREIQSMLADCGVTLRSMEEYPDLPDPVEDGNSYLHNAIIKAKPIAALTGKTVLSDDSGLEVDALGGAPGIHSARYAGDDANDDSNVRKLLGALQGVPPEKRGATFRCVLVLYRPDGRFHAFDEKWDGRIADQPAGKGGFGYDPVFYLPDRDMTAAELPAGIKNRISHRGKAVAKMRRWLREQTHETGA